MGIFSNFASKFSWRSKNAKRSFNELAIAVANDQDKSLEQGTASLNLQDLGLKFEDGTWKAEIVGKMSSVEVDVIKKENIRLSEENNMLKLKIAILLDMLSETTAESHILEKERNDAIKTVRKTLSLRS